MTCAKMSQMNRNRRNKSLKIYLFVLFVLFVHSIQIKDNNTYHLPKLPKKNPFLIFHHRQIAHQVG